MHPTAPTVPSPRDESDALACYREMARMPAALSTGARLGAEHAANVRAAADRRALRAELRAAEAEAEWRNLLAMLALPGRRPSPEMVARMGRAAKRSRAQIARVVALLAAAVPS